MVKIKCPTCGHVLELKIGYSGCDWNTKAGEGSGYGYELTLDCDCGNVYTLGHLKTHDSFTEMIDKLKVVK